MKNQITKSELSIQIQEQKYDCGVYLHYRGCNGLELYLITDKENNDTFYIANVDAKTLEVNGKPEKISLTTLKSYYQPVNMDINKVHALSLRLLDGEELEVDNMPEDDSTGTELMHLGSKETLVHLHDHITKAMNVASMVRKHAQCVADEMHRELQARLDKVNGVVAKMRTQIQRIEYVIETIETYAGIKEDIKTIQKGIPADEYTPIVIRQAVIYLDEEMALIDPEFDWQKMESFDKWLVVNNNYKVLMPDEKSIIAIKPRRRDKVYSNGNTAEDRYYNWIMNENNHITLFLIRNGENLYRIESEHIHLMDRFFPNENEYVEILKKEQEEERRGWKSKGFDDEGTSFRKRYTKVSFLLQGLLERSEVFAPHHFKGSLIKMEGLDGYIQMHYELDTSHLLADGRPEFRKWLQELNGNLTEGKRILLVNKGYNHAGYEFERNDFVKYYSSEWNLPGYPDDGVYTLYDSKPKDGKERYYKNHKFVIKFFGENPTYSWGKGFEKRKNRTSIHIDPTEVGVLNYDDLKMEDVDYYLNSRLHRSQYHSFVVMLQQVKKHMQIEQQDEQNFIKMMVGQMVRRGLTVKDKYTPEAVVKVALDNIKNRLKWKRPVSSKEKETYTLVERKLFSKEFQAKYFI